MTLFRNIALVRRQDDWIKFTSDHANLVVELYEDMNPATDEGDLMEDSENGDGDEVEESDVVNEAY